MKKTLKLICATLFAMAAVSTAFAKDGKNGVKMEKLKLVPYLTAMNLANKAVYGDFATKAEAEIEKVNASVAKRTKSPATAEASE